MIHLLAAFGVLNLAVFAFVALLIGVRVWSERQPTRRGDYTETMVGLYCADRELRAAAERMDARWLVID